MSDEFELYNIFHKQLIEFIKQVFFLLNSK